MKRWMPIIGFMIVMAFLVGCKGEEFPEKLEVPLKPAENYEGSAEGSAIINTETGTDIILNITGLDPDGLYTAFFVNIKSKMFKGIGEEPFVLSVDSKGTVNFKGKMKKDSYKQFVKLGIYLNPGGEPIKNPLGVKAKLGALMKAAKPKMILEGKLR